MIQAGAIFEWLSLLFPAISPHITGYSTASIESYTMVFVKEKVI
jgi:hypothetical protein